MSTAQFLRSRSAIALWAYARLGGTRDLTLLMDKASPPCTHRKALAFCDLAASAQHVVLVARRGRAVPALLTVRHAAVHSAVLPQGYDKCNWIGSVVDLSVSAGGSGSLTGLCPPIRRSRRMSSCLR
jgi:hypothetical protein